MIANMMCASPKKAVGIDIGQATVKGVCLAGRRRSTAVSATSSFDAQTEGIVGQEELFRNVAEWVRNCKWHSHEIVFGIPQDLATTQISDFPPNVSRNLPRLVRYETQQLAGLSEEPFLFDYTKLHPVYGRTNPILIGVCRQSMVQERENRLRTANLEPADIGMNGIAMANAYFDLYPDATEPEGPQVLLDIGHTSTTFVILAQDDIYYCGSLAFGSERYTRALAQHLDISENDAEQTKQTSRMDRDQGDSPLVQTTEMLETELHNALEQWRSQEQEELAELPFVRVCLCGGGSRLQGLEEYMQRSFNCETRTIGVKTDTNEDPDPALISAYGLALQGINHATHEISLATPATRWYTARRHRVGYLVLALVCFVGAVAFGFNQWQHSMQRELKQARTRTSELQTCKDIIPDLESIRSNIRQRERQILPFVSKGTRANRFIQSLDTLEVVQDTDGFLIYLADESAYRGQLEDGEKEGESQDSGRSMMVTRDKPFPELISVDQIPPLNSLIAAGFVPFHQHEPYAPVRDIVEKLNASEQFTDVDLLPEADRADRSEIFDNWLALFKNSDKMLYRGFMLKLPLATSPVALTSSQANGDQEDE